MSTMQCTTDHSVDEQKDYYIHAYVDSRALVSHSLNYIFLVVFIIKAGN
jgi:hypothetical protein